MEGCLLDEPLCRCPRGHLHFQLKGKKVYGIMGLFSQAYSDLSRRRGNREQGTGMAVPIQSLHQQPKGAVQGKVAREAGRMRSVSLRYRWFVRVPSRERPHPSFGDAQLVL